LTVAGAGNGLVLAATAAMAISAWMGAYKELIVGSTNIYTVKYSHR
jgi:hypothetical protein